MTPLVQVLKMGGARGTVLETPSSPRGNSQVQVDIGGLLVSAKVSDLRPSIQPRRTQQPAIQKRRKERHGEPLSSVSGGMPVAEAGVKGEILCVEPADVVWDQLTVHLGCTCAATLKLQCLGDHGIVSNGRHGNK